MNLKFLDDIRVYLSQKYLDWTENPPLCWGSFANRLKDIIEHQRSISENDYKECRPPEGIKIEYLYFRLIEMFHIEEFEKLRKCLVKLLPNLQDDYRSKDFLHDFRDFAKTIAGGGYRSVGCIYREVKGKLIFGKSFREIKALPPEVDYIVVSLHKILPSSFFVTLDVHLNKEATEHLLELQRRHYLPRIRFVKLAPWKIERGGYSQESVELVRIKEVFGWIDTLRDRVEKCIKPFLNGYFMQQATDKKPRLPLIEVYGMKGVPEGAEAFQTWEKGARRWLESLGLRFHFDTYGNGKVLFVWSNYNSTFRYSAYRLIVLWEAYFRTIKPDDFDGGKSAIEHDTKYTLDAILACIAIIEFLRSAQIKIEKLRQDVFGSMKIGFFSRYKMNRYIKLNNTIKHESMLLDRISMEFDQELHFIEHEMQPIKAIEPIKNISETNRDRNLRDVMIQSVKFNIDLLKKHVSLITNSFSEYLMSRNMEAMYRLQRSILGLTIIVTIVTIVSLAANWQNIKNFLYALTQTVIHNLFMK